MKNNPIFIMIHCTDVSEDQVFDQLKSVNAYHKDIRKFPISSLGYYVGYHYLITGGKIYQTRADTDIGAHCNYVYKGLSMNFQSISIGWGGDGDIELPSDTHRNLLKSLIGDLMKKYGVSIDKIIFHRNFNNNGKTCPGTLFTKEYMLELLRALTVDQEKLKKQEQIIAHSSKFKNFINQLLDLIKKYVYKL
jgi:hypothetical protein